MGTDVLLALGREAVLLMVLASLPPLLASMAMGILMGLVQATTQIQEPALASVPKLAAAILALTLSGPWISAQLVSFTARLMMAIGSVQL
jgi:flagellar biosynthetic protein FliQ